MGWLQSLFQIAWSLRVQLLKYISLCCSPEVISSSAKWAEHSCLYYDFTLSLCFWYHCFICFEYIAVVFASLFRFNVGFWGKALVSLYDEWPVFQLSFSQAPFLFPIIDCYAWSFFSWRSRPRDTRGEHNGSSTVWSMGNRDPTGWLKGQLMRIYLIHCIQCSKHQDLGLDTLTQDTAFWSYHNGALFHP